MALFWSSYNHVNSYEASNNYKIGINAVKNIKCPSFFIFGELDKMIKREVKQNLSKACFEYLPTKAEFDLLGWHDKDIFQHS